MSDVFAEAPAQSAKPTVFFDGVSSRRRQVALTLGDALEILEEGGAPVRWAYADIRRADSPAGILRLACDIRAAAGAAGNPRRRCSPQT